MGGGALRTHSYILAFLGFFRAPSFNVEPHMGAFPQPQQKYAGTGENDNFEIVLIF